MQAIPIIPTKGDATIAANSGSVIADAGLRILLLDLDSQPTVPSYYEVKDRAQGRIYKQLAFNQRSISRPISRTATERPGITLSNDEHNQLNTLLLPASDSGMRLRNLLPVFQRRNDLMMIDIQGSCTVLFEIDIIASGAVVAPVTPGIHTAPEPRRGTLKLIEVIAPYHHPGIDIPPLQLLINQAPPDSENSRLFRPSLRMIFHEKIGEDAMHTEVLAIGALPHVATQSLPAHRGEYRRPGVGVVLATLDIIRRLATGLSQHWRVCFSHLSGKIGRRHSHVNRS
ncbi:AAA family ATPase [Enterobacter sp. DTU_2021_1002640_1_SI_PRY_ASU_LCPMC_013]|uniref:ParA family protein n=1 Tax=Enterobacter sp. DTU_2021_1002640_1_SI_PRY_ASU_LCPMC_013 TaxID=3077940 RepID=UPI0028E6F554|nr:AAA family ATPase [Enterobacter sp. DTU_2021_1002640_1_SI_PRY_ASU_LCPMC_013]WNU98969.1 AAA family ATPase [Enterobacter sp. DTU_2021_1002640_1_SI_PRY_ASU_LCPMC_013]